MNAAPKEVIVFDNLVRPTEIIGENAQITAISQPSAFVNANAAGLIRQLKSLDEIRECSAKSGTNLREMLKAK